MANNADGTAQGLVEFFEYLADRGLMNRSTALARRTAVVRVMELDEGWEATDLRTLDVDEQVRRFHNLRKTDFAPKSLAAYEGRFRSAVEEYLKYLDNPAAYKPPTSSNHKTSKSKTARVTEDAVPANDSEAASVSRQAEQWPGSPVPPPPRTGHVLFPFPLRDGVMAYVQLPSDFRTKDAQRMARFLESLAIDPDEGD